MIFVRIFVKIFFSFSAVKINFRKNLTVCNKKCADFCLHIVICDIIYVMYNF